MTDLTKRAAAIAERLVCDCDASECTFRDAAALIRELLAEREWQREVLAAAYVKLSGKDHHASDCATSNAPAMQPGPCDCVGCETNG